MIRRVIGVNGGPARRGAFVAATAHSCRGARALLVAWVPEHFKRGSCGQETHHQSRG